MLKSTASVVQAVVRYSDGLHAESDPRKGGYAAGYWPPTQRSGCSGKRDVTLGHFPQRSAFVRDPTSGSSRAASVHDFSVSSWRVQWMKEKTVGWQIHAQRKLFLLIKSIHPGFGFISCYYGRLFISANKRVWWQVILTACFKLFCPYGIYIQANKVFARLSCLHPLWGASFNQAEV